MGMVLNLSEMFRDICLKFTKFSSPLYCRPTNTHPLNDNKVPQYNLVLSFPGSKKLIFL